MPRTAARPDQAIHGTAPWSERIAEVALAACGLVTVLTTLGILAVLAGESFAFFREVGLSRLIFDTQWTPLFADKHFGIWPLLSGTLLTSFIAVGVALPLGLLSAIFMSELTHRRNRAVLKPALEVLAGVPTIVYGYFALVVVTPALQAVIPGLAGFNALSAGIVMGFMITPMIASLAEDALYAVPHSLREAAYALGATRVATIWRVVVPAALGGIDSLVFTGGVGERSAAVRERVCQPLRFLGIQLDPQANARDAGLISARDSTVVVRVHQADEDRMIARQTYALTRNTRGALQPAAP